MVNIFKCAVGIPAFFIGFIVCYISQEAFPTMIDLLGNTLGGIMWFGVLIMWVLTLIVAPIGITLWGIADKGESDNKIFEVTAGVLYFVFMIALTYFGYYMVSTLTGVITYASLLAIFWVGFLLTWLTNTIGVPIYTIVKAKGDD